MPSRWRKGRLRLMLTRLHVKQVNSTTTILLLLRSLGHLTQVHETVRLLLRGQTFVTAHLTSGQSLIRIQAGRYVWRTSSLSATPSCPDRCFLIPHCHLLSAQPLLYTKIHRQSDRQHCHYSCHATRVIVVHCAGLRRRRHIASETWLFTVTYKLLSAHCDASPVVSKETQPQCDPRCVRCRIQNRCQQTAPTWKPRGRQSL